MRKNILILGHNDASQFIDIYNQYTKLFDPNEYAITVAYLTGKKNETTRKRTIAEEVIFLEIPKNKIRGLKFFAIRRLLSLCREKKFTIVITHRYKPTYIMLWVAQFYKIPTLIFVMHELKTMSPLARNLLITCLSRKNMIFAGVSNSVREDIRKSLKFIPAERIITLYNAIDVELTEPYFLSRDQARKFLQISANDFIFVNVARLVPNKDQSTLISAFSLVKPHCPQAKLLIVGEGELAGELKAKITALDLEKDILLTGYIDNSFRYLKAFDCFVLSSIQEAFGRVLIESMLAKLPIIATNAHGIPEVLGETGNLVEPGHIAGLAHAMQAMYHSSIVYRQRLAITAYERVLSNYSISSFKKQFWESLQFSKTKL